MPCRASTTSPRYSASGCDPGINLGDLGRPNEHHLQRFDAQVLRQRRSQRHKAVNLPAVGVPFGHDINESEAFLRRQGVVRQQDESGAGSEDGPALGVKLLEGGTHRDRSHELEQRRALSPRYDESLYVGEVSRFLYEFRLDPQFAKNFLVGGEVALQGQQADTPHPDYQPRVCSNSLSSRRLMSIPTIASPRSSDTRASRSASR